MTDFSEKSRIQPETNTFFIKKVKTPLIITAIWQEFFLKKRKLLLDSRFFLFSLMRQNRQDIAKTIQTAMNYLVLSNKF